MKIKKIVIAIASIIIIELGLPGCGNYLEENPDNRVDLDNVEKAAQVLTNAYSNGGYTFTDWMSDNVAFTPGIYRDIEHNQIYEWEEVTNDGQDTPTYFWTTTYDAIAHANEVLAVIDNLPGDRRQKQSVKGEAFLTRAYGHFMLVNLFAKHYNPETAAQDLGIPYVLQPEKVFLQRYTRQSVAEVYDKIEDDILAGLELVDESFYANSGKYHFTANAALALASRFYLFKGDFDKCIQYSSQMLANRPADFVKDIELLFEQYIESSEFQTLYSSPTDPSNLLLIRTLTNTNGAAGHYPSPALAGEIFGPNPWDADDIRVAARFPIFVIGSENYYLFGKFEFLFERSSLTSNVGYNYTIIPAFRGEEVVLNRAESYVYKNNLSAALADLQVLVNKRYVGAPSVTLNDIKSFYSDLSDQGAVLSFILDERRKEFIHEGLRWFDIKRYEIPVVHISADFTTPIELSGDDNRKVLQIPQAAIDIGGLEPNPR